MRWIALFLPFFLTTAIQVFAAEFDIYQSDYRPLKVAIAIDATGVADT